MVCRKSRDSPMR